MFKFGLCFGTEVFFLEVETLPEAGTVIARGIATMNDGQEWPTAYIWEPFLGTDYQPLIELKIQCPSSPKRSLHNSEVKEWVSNTGIKVQRGTKEWSENIICIPPKNSGAFPHIPWTNITSTRQYRKSQDYTGKKWIVRRYHNVVPTETDFTIFSGVLELATNAYTRYREWKPNEGTRYAVFYEGTLSELIGFD